MTNTTIQIERCIVKIVVCLYSYDSAAIDSYLDGNPLLGGRLS
jgi:hypothetical protein